MEVLRSLPTNHSHIRRYSPLVTRGAIGVRKSLGFYEQAVALDPGFAQAWVSLSRACSFLYWYSTPAGELGARARQAAEKAVALAPDRPEAYLALGQYQELVLNDSARALELYNRSLHLGPTNADLLGKKAEIEQGLGHWDEALENCKQAERLDPRAVGRKLVVGNTLASMRRFSEAREVLDRALALAPTNLELIESKAETFLGEGDLVRARAVIKAAPKEVEPTELVAFLSNSDDLVWILDEHQTELLLRLTPRAFDDNRAAWAICLAQAYALKSDALNLRAYAEEAREAFQAQLRETPQKALRRVFLGLALAYLGRKDEAIREGERAVALRPVVIGDHSSYNQHQLVRIYILVGEPEKALDKLEPLLKIPSGLSPGWLKIDPNFDPLRNNPRFQKLVAGAK